MTIAWFEKLLGKENISDEIIDLEVYSTDASKIKGKTDKVVWITNAQQAHQLVLYARRNKKSIVPRGAGTSLVGSTVPFDSIVLDFSKMNKIEQIGKDYITVEPGVICDDVNKLLKDKFFPIIPEDSSVCTIGGMCGVNSSSIYQKRFGKMKDWVIEVEMIDGHGRLKKYGPEILGTEGTIGIITKIKLRITDKIHEKSVDLLKFDKIQQLIEKLSQLNNNNEAIAIEYISKHAASLIGLEENNYLIVEYMSFEGHIKDQIDIERIENVRRSIFSKIAMQEYIYREDPFIPIENMAEFLYWLESKAIPSFGPIGISIIHPCFKERDSEELNEVVKKLNGHFGEKFGIGVLKKDTLSEMKKYEFGKLKEEFDPFKILNNGKLI